VGAELSGKGPSGSGAKWERAAAGLSCRIMQGVRHEARCGRTALFGILAAIRAAYERRHLDSCWQSTACLHRQMPLASDNPPPPPPRAHTCARAAPAHRSVLTANGTGQWFGRVLYCKLGPLGRLLPYAKCAYLLGWKKVGHTRVPSAAHPDEAVAHWWSVVAFAASQHATRRPCLATLHVATRCNTHVVPRRRVLPVWRRALFCQPRMAHAFPLMAHAFPLMAHAFPLMTHAPPCLRAVDQAGSSAETPLSLARAAAGREVCLCSAFVLRLL
jgi:hypothetical protein